MSTVTSRITVELFTMFRSHEGHLLHCTPIPTTTACAPHENAVGYEQNSILRSLNRKFKQLMVGCQPDITLSEGAQSH